MPSLGSAVCLKCEEIYDSTTRKICSSALCSHSICEPCFDQKTSSTCPTCAKPDSYATKNINYQAMELLDRLKEDMSLKVIAAVKSDPELQQLKQYPKNAESPTCAKPDSYATKNINYQAMELLDRLKEDMSLKVIAEGISNPEGKMRIFEDFLSELDDSIELVETSGDKITLDLLHKLFNLFNTANDLPKLGPDDYQRITEILESGTLQLDKKMNFKSMTIAKDIKRTIPFKIPPQYEKYADLAGSCFNAFFR
ncbi:Protein CBG21785 [Caenorhabditis briggsae]|uniref:Protein CBG21785 n=1 Tax=Caenorhabditis briggsae TaxID=6238 RepID=A8Y0H6_CAEBR|nr:Protein CBG21785 [Caenorhabditis briggsae]CAP38394.2 Protein CBG21785 [Caenorhabditis briggsae]